MLSNVTFRREKAVRRLGYERNLRSATRLSALRVYQYELAVQRNWNAKKFHHQDNYYWLSVLDITAVNVLSPHLFDRARALFREMRINKVQATFIPYASHDATGDYQFAVCDGGSPILTVRKTSGAARLIWEPVEPHDQNWHPFSDGHYYCSLVVASANVSRADPLGQFVHQQCQGAKLSGRIIVDVSVSFRGNCDVDAFCGYRFGTPEFTAFMQFCRCNCSKCARVIKSAFTAETLSQSQILVDQEDSVGEPTLYGFHVRRSRAYAVKHPSQGEEGGAR